MSGSRRQPGRSRLSEKEEAELRLLLDLFHEVEITSGVIDQAISIRRKRSVKIPDALIGATALLSGCTVITRNENDFKGIEGLTILNPDSLL